MSEASNIEIRALNSEGEFAEAVRLQRQIWAFHDVELLPVRMFVVASSVGGQTFGAYCKDHMVGFLLAIPGLKPGGRPYLHSHMLGVSPKHRNAGIGRMLKLRQREEALARGIQLIEWTFDPLEVKNGFFNLERLGASVRRYVLNQYGTTTSHLHAGLPTDRCTAEWWIDSDRVRALLEGRALPRPPIEARIEVPAAIKHSRREIQKSVSQQFLDHLGRGLAAVGFERTESGGVYLLAKD